MLHVGAIAEDMELIGKSTKTNVDRIQSLVHVPKLLNEKLSVQHITHITSVCGI